MNELKKHLSTLVQEASQGARILITRHKKPTASLASADLGYVHIGEQFGKAKLEPLLRAASRGRYLELLEQDRRERGRRRT